jgi:peptidoglycan/LPS O-acetylase OafA/YrhL
VDGLRALAVLPVVLLHAGVPGLPGGFAGVDVFFVISGYLIAGTVLADLERGRFGLTAFYWRRARRILPALVVLLASAVAAWAILLPADLREFGWSTVAAATFWSNLHFWKSTNYFAIDAGLRPLLHTWSLSVEEQYYIVAPVAMWVVHRFMGRRWLLVLVPLIALSSPSPRGGTTAAASATFYLLPTRAWELMLGALLVVRPPPAARSAREASLLGLLGLALLVWTYATLSKDDPFPGLGALAPCLGALLLIHAGSGPRAGSPRASCRCRPSWAWAHLLLAVPRPLAHHRLRRPTPRSAPTSTRGPSSSPSLLLAWLSWRLVEQPFRAPLPRNRPAVIFPLSGAGIAACALVGWAFVAGDGLPRRFPGFAARAVAVEPWRNGTCFNENGPLDGFTVEGCVRDLASAARASSVGATRSRPTACRASRPTPSGSGPTSSSTPTRAARRC